MLLLKLSVRRNIPPLALFTPAPKNFLSVTLKEAEGDSSLVKQVKAPVLLNLKEWYQDDDIQKLMKIGMLLYRSRVKEDPFPYRGRTDSYLATGKG